MITNKIKFPLYFLLVLVLSSSCDKSTSTDTEKQIEKPLPTKPQGLLPLNGELCSVFESVANDESKASILFTWNASKNAVNYDLSVFEGSQEIDKITVGALEARVVLDKGKSYTWQVSAINETGVAQSDTYSFTTPGQSILNYAPYAAEIFMEFDTDNKLLNINWMGSDEDGDSLVFDVQVTENEVLLFEETNLEQQSLGALDYIENATYYVSVRTTDSFGNFSISEKEQRSPD